MSLSNDLISQFVKATQDPQKPEKDVVIYGTIKKEGNRDYVKLDGADLLTPVTSTTVLKQDDRVTVMIKNHTAVVTGNITSPSAQNADVQSQAGKINDFEIVIAGKVSAGELDVEKSRINSLVSENVLIKQTLTANEAILGEVKADNVSIKGKITAAESDIAHMKTQKLDAEMADLKYATIGKLDVTDQNVHNLTGDYSSFKVMATDKFKANDADILNIKTKKLDADQADLKYASIGNFEAMSGKVGVLEIDINLVKTLIGGTVSAGSIQTIVLNAENTTIENALIKSAMIASVSADKVTAGTIDTSNIHLKSSSGNMDIFDNTILIRDSIRPRVQMGKDATGDYGIYIWDKAGNLMFDATGVTSDGIQKPIIRNDMVSPNANIDGSKINISSVITEINNGVSKIQASHVLYDGKSLDIAFNEMQTAIENPNMIANGNGEQRDNTNFSSFVYDGVDHPLGTYGSFVASKAMQIDKMIPFNPDKDYTISFWHKVMGDLPSDKKWYFSLRAFDADGLEIKYMYVNWYGNTLTKLAKPINNGDTVIYFESLDNWSKTTSVSYQRGFIAWNYRDSKGYVYPPQTYSRNIYRDIYINGDSVDKVAKTITLKAPWSNGAISAGTSICQCTDGNSFPYIGVLGNAQSTWTKFDGIFGKSDHILNVLFYAKTILPFLSNVGTTKPIKIAGLYIAPYAPTNDVIKNMSTQINVQQGKIAALITDTSQTKQDLTDTRGTLTTLQSNYSSLQQTVTGLNVTVGQHTSSITKVSNDLNNLEIGGRNLIKKSSFDIFDRTYWTATVGSIITTGIADPYGGKRALHFKAAQANSYILLDRGRHVFPSVGVYSLSIWLRGNKAGKVDVTLNSSSAHPTGKYITCDVMTTWKKFTLTCNVDNLTLGYDFVIGGYSSWIDLSFELDIAFPMLVSGNKPTDWTPAPEDTASDIKTVSDKQTLFQASLDGILGEVSRVESSVNANSSAISTLKLDYDGFKTNVSKTYTTKADSAASDEISRALGLMGAGKLLYQDPTFTKGVNGVGIYDNSGKGNLIVARIAKPADCPTLSGYCMKLTSKALASPGLGGFVQSISSRANAKFIIKYLVKLPVGYGLRTASNSMGTGYTDKFVGSSDGTGMWQEYIRVVTCGSTGVFSSGGHVYVMGATPTALKPLEWHLGAIYSYDVTDANDVYSKFDNYSTTTQMNSAITQKANEINLSVTTRFNSYSTTSEINNSLSLLHDEMVLSARKKVGKDEIISSINLTPETIKIKAQNIAFEGLVTANNNFKILADGSMEAANATLSGTIKATSGYIGDFSIVSGEITSQYTPTGGRIQNYVALRAGQIIVSTAGLNSVEIGNGIKVQYPISPGLLEDDILTTITGKQITSPKVVAKHGFETSNFNAYTAGKTVYGTSSIELFGAPPFIDFHANNSDSDFTSRLIDWGDGWLKVHGMGFNAELGAKLGTIYTPGGTEWLGLYTAGFGQRKAWIGHNGGNNLEIVNETTGGVALYTMGAYIWFERNTSYTSFRPASNISGGMTLGMSWALWGTVYSSSGSISTSDRNKKHDIRPLNNELRKQLFKELNPVSYILNDSTSGRTHYGFISQDVESSMTRLGMNGKDFAGFCKDQAVEIIKNEDGSEVVKKKFDSAGNPIYDYSLRYEEFISLNTMMIQENTKELDSLKEKIANLEQENQRYLARLDSLQNLVDAFINDHIDYKK